jgi:hypothetical protein
MESTAVPGPVMDFKGGSWNVNCSKFDFCLSVSGKSVFLGQFSPEAAVAGARRRDALHLLLHGPHADTNFEWSSYTRADIAAAASFLEAKGLDVHQAVAFAREARGDGWNGVHFRKDRPSWTVHLQCQRGENGNRTAVDWYGLRSAEAAAHQADCGFLAIRGLGCTTNFPASTYSQQQLEAAGEYAVSKGAKAACVAENLAAVQQVRGRAGATCTCWMTIDGEHVNWVTLAGSNHSKNGLDASVLATHAITAFSTAFLLVWATGSPTPPGRLQHEPDSTILIARS